MLNSTNIKTWISDLRAVSGAVRAADMSVAAIGAVDYAKALDGLSLKQAQLMLTTQGIVGEEQKDLLVKQGLIATSDRMSASIVSEALANNGLNKEKQEELLIDLGLMNSKTKELITENAVTEARLRGILAEKSITGAKADTLIASILQTGQNAKEAISWDVLAASIKKSMIALAQNPLTWIAVAVGAVVGFIKVVDHFAITAEKLNEQLQELKATEEELISTQDKLTEIDNKIAEIQSKGTLSITDNADISRLQTEKSLLEDEIELLKIRKELQQDEYNKNAKKYADGEYSNYTHGQGDITHLMNSYKGYKAKSERTDIDDYFIEDAKRGLKETEAELIEYRNTINENLANLAPDDEESRKKLETIREAIEKLIYAEEELAKIKFDRFIIDPNNTGISEGFEKIKSDGEVTTQEITELASKFPTLKKFMDDNGISAETLAAELNNVGTEAENSGENVNEMTVSLSELEKTSDNIKTLSSAFKELSDDGYITTKTLGEIQEATGLAGDEWAGYEQKLLNAKKGSAEFNQVMSDLTYAMLEKQLGTDKLASADEAYIARVLQENGVLNANVVAQDMVKRASEEAGYAKAEAAMSAYANALASGEDADAAYKNAEALINEGSGSLWAAQAMEHLNLIQDIFNNSNLDASQKIAELQKYGFQASLTAAQLQSLADTSLTYSDGKWWVNYFEDDKDNNGEKDYLYSEEYKGFDFKAPEITIPQYSSGSKYSSSSKADDAKKAEEERIQKELEALKAGLETREKLLERYKKAVDLTDFGLDLAEENDFALRADLLNNKMSQLTSYGTAMREEFNRVASIIPKTGEEAEALASHLETLGSDMRDNIKNLRETRVAMEQLKIDSISSIGDYYLGDLENELSNIEKRIELLNKDNKKDYKYTNKILQMEMFLPTASSTTGAQNRRRQADQEIINAEQATQDVLNDMFEEQIKKNDKLREDERQALLEDMETMRQDVVLKLESVNKDYDSSWQTAQDTTNTGITNIENSLNNMDMKIPAPDISAVITACEQVKDMLDHMGDADYTPPKLRISDGIDGGDANSIIRGNKPNIVSNVAKNQLGVPYVWGGIAPGEGLDCSGLTQYAYGVAGVSLPRRSQEQWSCGTGTRIDWKDLKKGDQLFFGSSGEATHTGIYVGNGQMIHAPHTGDVVKYSSIESEYYQSNFLGAKRYAVGTPNGNDQASRFGIAGENFKPEILIDKATGETKYIDKPTLIDITKTDVVGERATAKIPKFASGTISPSEIASYIRGNYPEITDAGIAAILANIQQESSFNPKAKTIEAYGSGSNKQIARWGLFQLDDTRISNWSDIVNNGSWQEQIDTALAEGRYANSGMGGLSKYNVWDNVLTNPNLNASEAAKMFDTLYERSDGKSNSKRALNAEKYFAQIKDNTLALEANTEAMEETDPNKLKIKEIQEYVNGVAGEIDEALSSTKIGQLEIMNDDSLSDRDKTYGIFDVYKLSAESAAKIGTDAYTTLLKEFSDWYQKTETDDEIFKQETFDSYVDALSELKDEVIDIEETTVSLKETIVGYMEDDLSKIDQYIEDRNFFGDWELFGDSEPEAIKRQIETITEAYKRNALSPEAYNKYIKDYEKALYSSYQETLTDELDFAISKVGSLKTLLQSHFDITNAISDTQYQINKELTASKTMYEYLDKDTRKLLFNQEDYNILTEELNSIQDKANKLQDEYNDKIRHATAENLDEITSKYEMQYDLLMKSYEIKKADLEITKKQQQLNNVLNERNVRMFINGQWRWVANTQDVINAQNELADAQYAKRQAKTSRSQTKEMNDLTKAENTLTTTINNVENGIVEFDDQVGDINKTLKSINVNELPSLKNVLGNAASAISSFVKEIKRAKIDTPISYSKNIDYSTEMQNSAYTADGKEYLNDSKRNSKIEGEGLSYPAHDNIDFSHYDPVGNAYKENDYMQEIIDKANKGDLKGALIANKNRNHKIDYLGLDSATKFTDDDIKALVKTQDIDRPNYNANAYATGTNNATQGFSKLGEIEDELFINSHGRLIPINQPTLTNMQGGEMVFNGAQLAGARALWEMVNMPSFGVNNLPIIDRAQSSQSTVDNRIIINGMTVDSGSPEGQALIDAFRRYIPTHS